MHQRLNWLDIAKGITIILMVLGHTSIPKLASDFIWSFHMPLFFVASGWCTNWSKYSFSTFTTNKLRTLGMPFLIYSGIVLCLMESIDFRYPIHVVYNGWQGYALWFVPVFFFALLLSKLVMTVKSKYVHILLWISTAAIGTGLCYAKVALPWTLCTIPYASFLIILGSKAKAIQEYITPPRWWILVGGFVITAIVSHFYRLDMAWNNITPVTILTVGACAGTMMMFTLSSYIEKYTKYPSKILQAIGKETYLILAFSQIIIVLLNHYFAFNSTIKYALLVVILVVLKYTKDEVNKLMGKRIL